MRPPISAPAGRARRPSVVHRFGATILALAVVPPVAADAVDPVVTEDEIVTRFDRVPRFCNVPDVTAVASGSWSNPATWSSGVVPEANARVLISTGTSVEYDLSSEAEIDCVEIAAGGALVWHRERGTRLRVTNLQVLPGGRLELGDLSSPIRGAHRAEIVFSDRPLDVDGRDPAQYGNGLHVFGELTVSGRRIGLPFARLAADALSGSTLVELERSPIGWRPGDRLIVPDTRQIPYLKNHVFTSQAEELELASIDGSSLELGRALSFDHRGPRDADGRVGELERTMLPHVGHLTRNVTLRSTDLSETSKDRYCRGAENLDATDECVTRGHVMVHARAALNVRYAAFENLGRTTVDELDSTIVDDDGTPIHIGTNQVGRYSLHAHHLAGPENPTDRGFQYRLVGNVFEGFLKWAVAVHDTHYGLLRGNVVYGGDGSAIATEDGNESYNLFERNFVVHTKAGTEEQILDSTGRGGVENQRALFGFTRDGFWFSGMNNIVRDNVVANAPDFAYNYNGYYLTPYQTVPNFRGADTEIDGTLETALPVLRSTRNEAYGATGQGLWLTWSRGCCNVALYDGESRFESFRLWHINNTGIEAYHESDNTFDDFVLRNDPAVSELSGGGSRRFNRGFNLGNGSYENGRTIFRRVDVQGFNVGLQLPPKPEDETPEPNRTLVVDSFLKNYVNVELRLPTMSERETRLENVRMETLDIAPTPGLPAAPTSIHMRYEIDRHTNLVDRSGRVLVRDFNGVPGADFEVYFIEQGPDYPIPPPPEIDHPNYHVCPESDLTNQECWDRHGIAVSGRVAPCVEVDGDPSCAAARQRAEERGIVGLTFP